ncbi:ArsR/SmtB family transcription factor [Corynebacterium frankenforstense]
MNQIDPGRPEPDDPEGAPAITAPHQNLTERLAELEARVARLEGTAGLAGTEAPEPARDADDPDLLPWAVRGLREHSPLPGGSVLYAGDVRVGGASYSFQWERETAYLTEGDWDEAAERLAAVAHPVRTRILRRLLEAPATAAELVEEGAVSSTGAAYHHLGALHAAGWTGKSPAGAHHVRPARVVALLTLILATDE